MSSVLHLEEFFSGYCNVNIVTNPLDLDTDISNGTSNVIIAHNWDDSDGISLKENSDNGKHELRLLLSYRDSDGERPVWDGEVASRYG